jgi:hypothetical protein
MSCNVGVELGQFGFIVLVLAVERTFSVLHVRWPDRMKLLPRSASGSIGAFWTIERVAVLF